MTPLERKLIHQKTPEKNQEWYLDLLMNPPFLSNKPSEILKPFEDAWEETEEKGWKKWVNVRGGPQ